MREDLEQIRNQVAQALSDLHEAMPLSHRHLLLVGASTSEVVGAHIGTAGTFDVAEALFEPIRTFCDKHGVRLALQCCEHLNRALLVEAETAEQHGSEQVLAVPVRHAGGALAAHAYRQMAHPVLVASIQADAGIDVGDVFIGMHLKPVVIPVRSRITQVGDAHVSMARTRLRRIGGERAVYTAEEAQKQYQAIESNGGIRL